MKSQLELANEILESAIEKVADALTQVVLAKRAIDKARLEVWNGRPEMPTDKPVDHFEQAFSRVVPPWKEKTR
jgi:hypothetical protein